MFCWFQGDNAGPTDANVKQVVKNLKETYLLSDFLDRLTEDSRQIAQVKDEPKVPSKLRGNDPEMDQLAALQSDEESITNGIEKLLHSIQSGNAMHVADALKPDADKKTPEGKSECVEVICDNFLCRNSG